MKQKLTNSLSPFVKLIFDLVITFVVFIFLFVIGLFVGAKLFDLKVFDLLNENMLFENLAALRYVVLLQTLSLFFFPSVAIAYFFSNPAEFLNTRNWSNLKAFIYAILAFLIAQIFIDYLAFLNQKIPVSQSLYNFFKQSEQKNIQITQHLLYSKTIWDYLINLIVVALIPAISEEFFFRGVLQKHFIETFKNPHAGIILTAFVFAFVHFQFLTFLPRFVLGLMLGYIYFWSKSIWLSATAHFTNNALGVTMYFIAQRKGIALENLQKPHQVQLWAALLSLIIVVYLLKLIYDNSKN